MSKFKQRATPQQMQAIVDQGQNILVAASAGSGKTAVLIERLRHRIIGQYLETPGNDESLLNDVSNFLVVTFTNAAATQMKDRLKKGLEEELADLKKEVDPVKQKIAREFLNQQLSQINVADISTLHAFCLHLLRKYYYALDLDPNFRLLVEDNERSLLRNETWEAVREKYYAGDFNDGQEDSDFNRLVTVFGSDRDDDALTAAVFAVDNYAMATANPDSWLQEISRLYDFHSGQDYSQTKLWQEQLQPALDQELRVILGASQKYEQDLENKLLGLMEDYWQGEAYAYYEEKKPAKFVPDQAKHLEKYQLARQAVAEFNQSLTDLVENHDQLTYTKLQAQVAQLSLAWPRLIRAGRGAGDFPVEAEGVKNQIKAQRDAINDHLSSLKERYLAYSNEELQVLMSGSQGVVRKLVEVVQTFQQAYYKLKQRRHLLEFNDLEHLTLELLAGRTEQTQKIAQILQEQYQEIMVDEYQDTNGIQEAIIRALAPQKPGKIFMVGDVKQSIYQFRLAKPQLFTDKYDHFEVEAQDGQDELIVLQNNYRSAQTVTGFTNLIFSQLMDKSLGEISYDQLAQLVSANNVYAEAQIPAPTILVYESQETASDQEVSLDFTIDSKEAGQIQIVLQKIKELVGQAEIIDRENGGQKRKIKYGDIAILASTHGDSALIAEKFQENEVPVQVDNVDNYFQTTEIKLMLAMLNIIDNPHQDIPLVAVLRSPMYGFNENELAYLRINTKQGDFYGTLTGFRNLYEAEAKGISKLFKFKNANKDNLKFETDLYAKVVRFLDDLTTLRVQARRAEIAPLIWSIYEKTGFLDFVTGMPGGKQRQANLHALYERAQAYEQTNYRGIFRFLGFIKKLQEHDKDLAEINQEDSEDAVHFMTIHKSKGLEFPVVFVINTTKRFNQHSLTERYILDDDLGLGIQYISQKISDDGQLEFYLQQTTPVYQVIRAQNEKKMLAEEMRKLYVALTRSEQYLYLVGEYKDQATALKKWLVAKDDEALVLERTHRQASKNYLDWLGMALVRTPHFQDHVMLGQDRLADLVASEAIDLDVAQAEMIPADLQADFAVEFWTDADLAAQSVVVKEEKTPSLAEWQATLGQVVPKDNIELQAIREVLDFKYEQTAKTQTAAYQAVTDLKPFFADPDMNQMQAVDVDKLTLGTKADFQPSLHTFSQPEFMTTEEKITPAAVGTATHLVFQKLTLDKEPDLVAIEAVIKQAVADRLVTDKVAEKINRAGILAFYQSPLGRAIIANHSQVHREAPFSLLYPAGKIFADLGDDDQPLLIHGIIDGYFVDTKGKVILFDYKTDHVAGEAGLESLKQKYQGQMNLYALALESITGQKVAHRYLYAVAAQKVIEI